MTSTVAKPRRRSSRRRAGTPGLDSGPGSLPQRAAHAAVRLSLAVALLLATAGADARVTWLMISGDGWSCGSWARPTHAVSQLLVSSGCAFSSPAPDYGRYGFVHRYDWARGFVPGPALARGLSADGRWMVSSEPLIDSRPSDVWLDDLETGSRTRVSRPADGSASLGANYGARLSADGERVLFSSNSPNVAAMTTALPAVLEWRREDGAITLLETDASLLAASADGQVLVVSPTFLFVPDIKLIDRRTGRVELYCSAADLFCNLLSLSPDGRYLAYEHGGNPPARVVRDRLSGTDEILPGRGGVVFDQASTRMAWNEPVGGADPHAYRIVVRNLADGSESDVFLGKKIYDWTVPAAFGPGAAFAVQDDGIVGITSLDLVHGNGFE